MGPAIAIIVISALGAFVETNGPNEQVNPLSGYTAVASDRTGEVLYYTNKQ